MHHSCQFRLQLLFYFILTNEIPAGIDKIKTKKISSQSAAITPNSSKNILCKDNHQTLAAAPKKEKHDKPAARDSKSSKTETDKGAAMSTKVMSGSGKTARETASQSGPEDGDDKKIKRKKNDSTEGDEFEIVRMTAASLNPNQPFDENDDGDDASYRNMGKLGGSSKKGKTPSWRLNKLKGKNDKDRKDKKNKGEGYKGLASNRSLE